jgi:broad specificity phosphatase PhoE
VIEVVLVRHAEAESNAEGVMNGDPSLPVDLTAAGRSQARGLGRALADEPLDLCVTTEFLRTSRTAELALGGRNVPTRIVADLNDPSAGAWEGMALDDYFAWARAASPLDTPPGGESLHEVTERYCRGFRTLLEAPERRVLAVIHGLPISIVLHATGEAEERTIYPVIPNATPHRLDARALGLAIERIEYELRC